MVKENEAARPAGQTAYGKEQLMASARYAPRRDLLSALLRDEETYTVSAVDVKIKTYLKGGM